MIRLNQQRLIRQRLPLRFLTVTLLVALLWFIVMFLYVDDLISEQTHGTRRHVVRAARAHSASSAGPDERGAAPDDVLGARDTGETLVVYDHDTGRRLEVERVEDEYVEIWEHGKWVRATDSSTVSSSTTTSSSSSSSSAPASSWLAASTMTSPADAAPGAGPRVLSPYSRIRKKPKRVEVPPNGHVSNDNVHREDDFILLDEDAVTSRDAQVREPPSVIPVVMATSGPGRRPPEAPESPHPADHGGPRGSDDFHFAPKEILSTSTLATLPKFYHNMSSPRVIPSKSPSADRLLSFPPSAHVPPSTSLPVRRVVKSSRRFSNPKSARLRYSLVEPRQLPLPKHSGSSRRSATGGRRTKHNRGPYVEPPHVNINAKAGARINYVNINKRSIVNYQNNNVNTNNNLGNDLMNSSNKTVRLKRLQSQHSDTMHANTTSHSRQFQSPGSRLPPHPGSAKPAVLYYSQSVQKVAAREAPSLDFRLDVQDGYGRHSFNVSASNSVPLLRELPDTRPKSCLLSPPHPATPVLPMATVVICFHNEAWSTLLRTIHSVLSRSPAHLLKEIILVDDFSAYDYLGARLETYIARFPQIQLVRTHKREGLIRARLLGVSYARGDVLVFLDSHCECNRQWLEPLLYAITQDRNKIACPQIDIINPDNLGYEGAPPRLHGGFNWHLQFVWKEVPEHQGAIRVSESDPIRTPTMIGGLFAVNRRYFLDIGAYDPGMDIWGSENLELSFRVWMCGGSIDILPCSRVGHLFRPVIPYGFPDGARATLHHNAMRVAEVWMDQYSKFYYASQALPRDPAVLRTLTDRHNLRRSLACNDFTWYLKNIVPEMDIPPLNGHHYGQLRNKDLKLCMHFIEGSINNSLQMASCQRQLYGQQFAVTTSGEFVHYFQCVYIRENIPSLSPCGKVALAWSVTKEGQVIASDSKKMAPLCLDIRGVSVVMATCDVNKTSQLWYFTYRFDINKLNIKY